jgi:hypothetical protein
VANLENASLIVGYQLISLFTPSFAMRNNFVPSYHEAGHRRRKIRRTDYVFVLMRDRKLCLETLRLQSCTVYFVALRIASLRHVTCRSIST